MAAYYSVTYALFNSPLQGCQITLFRICHLPFLPLPGPTLSGLSVARFISDLSGESSHPPNYTNNDITSEANKECSVGLSCLPGAMVSTGNVPHGLTLWKLAPQLVALLGKWRFAGGGDVLGAGLCRLCQAPACPG